MSQKNKGEGGKTFLQVNKTIEIRRRFRSYYFIVVIAWLVFYFCISNLTLQRFLMLILALLLIGGLVYYNRLRKQLSVIISNELYENIDFKQYLDCYRLMIQSEKNSRFKAYYKEISKIAEAEVAYYKGNTSDATQFLNSVDFLKIPFYYRNHYRQQVVFYRLLVGIATGTENVTQIHGQLTVEQLTLLESIELLSQGATSDYFDNVETSSKLEKIRRCYYSALHQVNQGNSDQAKAHFQTIANENPELFYVREAKKYLEER